MKSSCKRLRMHLRHEKNNSFNIIDNTYVHNEEWIQYNYQSFDHSWIYDVIQGYEKEGWTLNIFVWIANETDCHAVGIQFLFIDHSRE